MKGTMDHQEQMQLLYLTYFNRAADHSGLEYWQSRLEAGESLSSVRKAFANPEVPEVQELYKDIDEVTDYTTLVYRNLLNREPDPEGQAFWNEQIQGQMDGGQSLENAGLSILAAFMEAAASGAGQDADTLDAKLFLASAVTEASRDNPQQLVELSNQYLGDAGLGTMDEQALAALKDTLLSESQEPVELVLDALQSSDLEAAILDAEGDSFVFEDDVALQSHTRIVNFGADDTLRLVDVEASDVRVQVSGDNTMIQFDDGESQLSQIELVGVSGFFTGVTEFNQDTSIGDIVIA